MTEITSLLAKYALKLPTAYYCSVAGIVGAGFGALFIKRPNVRLNEGLNVATYLNITLTIIAACSYLFYPGYIDHVESTIATLGIIFNGNEKIYPELTEYSFHGLLYGPALTEIQALFQRFGLPLIGASKLASLISLLISLLVALRLMKDRLSRSYLILLLPFGLYLFWNRAEPIILLCVALTLVVHPYLNKPTTRIWSVFFVGLLAGLASGIKIHAALYVGAALFACNSIAIMGVAEIFALICGFAFTSILVYSPEQISVFSFFNYIKVAGKHGLDLRLLFINIIYFLFLMLPLVYINYRDFKDRGRIHYYIWVVFLIESTVVLVGAKAGAGAHHLMHFIPINACILQNLLKEERKIPLKLEFFSFQLLFVAFGAFIVTGELAWKMVGDFSSQNKAKQEILQLADRYPGLTMGVSDMNGYPYTFYRPLLELNGTRQIDFPAFMDLEFSGISDDPLVKALSNCNIPYLAVPNSGEPFSIENYYTSKPLMSTEVRKAFRARYKIVESAEIYSVYKCAR
jgi:hypothetical protein